MTRNALMRNIFLITLFSFLSGCYPLAMMFTSGSQSTHFTFAETGRDYWEIIKEEGTSLIELGTGYDTGAGRIEGVLHIAVFSYNNVTLNEKEISIVDASGNTVSFRTRAESQRSERGFLTQYALVIPLNDSRPQPHIIVKFRYTYNNEERNFVSKSIQPAIDIRSVF